MQRSECDDDPISPNRIESQGGDCGEPISAHRVQLEMEPYKFMPGPTSARIVDLLYRYSSFVLSNLAVNQNAFSFAHHFGALTLIFAIN